MLAYYLLDNHIMLDIEKVGIDDQFINFNLEQLEYNGWNSSVFE